MAQCDYCKTMGQKTETCVHCGAHVFGGAATFIFGPSRKDSEGCNFSLTRNYLIVRAVSKGSMVGSTAAAAAGGLVGALVASAVDAAKEKSFGFYDLREIQTVIYPYHAKGLKKDLAFRFINRDGSDFVLLFDLNGMFCKKTAQNFAKALSQVGLQPVAGDPAESPCCCCRPFLDKTTFGNRLCVSAAAFMPQAAAQRAQNAPPMAAPKPVPTPAPQSYAYAPAPRPQHHVYPSAPAPAPKPVYPPAPQPPAYVPAPPPARPCCPVCGTLWSAEDVFCWTCGKPYEP